MIHRDDHDIAPLRETTAAEALGVGTELLPNHFGRLLGLAELARRKRRLIF